MAPWMQLNAALVHRLVCILQIYRAAGGKTHFLLSLLLILWRLVQPQLAHPPDPVLHLKTALLNKRSFLSVYFICGNVTEKRH